MSLRKLLFWLHLSVGVVAGLVILVMSVTGVLLTYEKQMLASSARGLQTGGAPAEPLAQPATAVLAAVKASENGKSPTSLQFSSNPAMPVAAVMSRERTIYVDSRTAQVLGEASPGMRQFFRDVTSWHRWFAREGDSRKTAKSIFDASNLFFLVLVLSGLVLWIPRPFTSQRVKQVAVFRRGLGPKARDFNWHNVAGLWMGIPLAIVVASGVVISYPWAAGLVYKAYGEEAPKPQAQTQAQGGGGEGRGGEARGSDARSGENRQPRSADEVALSATTVPAEPTAQWVSYDSILAVAKTQDPNWRTISITLPRANAKDVTVAIDAGTGGQPQLRQTLTLDLATAGVIKTAKFDAQTPGRRMRSLLRFAHTGEVVGVWGQTIAGIASLAGVLLVWTGLWLSFRRLAAFLRRRRREGSVPVAAGESVAA